MLKNFRTYQLSVEFYKKSKNLNFKGAVREQFSRASLSISLNLAEGTGKSSKKDRRRFYEIAMGSTRECQAILTLENLEDTELNLILDRLAGSIYKLIKNVM